MCNAAYTSRIRSVKCTDDGPEQCGWCGTPHMLRTQILISYRFPPFPFPLSRSFHAVLELSIVSARDGEREGDGQALPNVTFLQIRLSIPPLSLFFSFLVSLAFPCVMDAAVPEAFTWQNGSVEAQRAAMDYRLEELSRQVRTRDKEMKNQLFLYLFFLLFLSLLSAFVVLCRLRESFYVKDKRKIACMIAVEHVSPFSSFPPSSFSL